MMGLLLGLQPGPLAVQMAEAAVLEVLANFGGGEAGQQILGRLPGRRVP